MTLPLVLTMADMYELPLWEQISHCMKMLDTALLECKTRGAAMVAAEAEYYTAKSQESYELLEAGHANTFIQQVIKGRPKVCEKMAAYHAAEVEYENAREARNVWKKKLDTLREQYSREWGQAGIGE